MIARRVLRTAAIALGAIGLACGGFTACSIGIGSSSNSSTALRGIHKIQHVVVIMMENRSFDEYFGTYPGADGLPKKEWYVHHLHA